MAYDAIRNNTVLFGGKTNVGNKYWEEVNETRIWNGANWQYQHLSSPPPARSGANLVYDEANKNIVLFGGGAGGGILDDTWVWNGTIWIEQKTPYRSPARSDFGMAYHPLRKQIILFGGQTYRGLINDTWIWDGQDWVHLQTKQSPPMQMTYGNQLVYIPSLRSIVLYNAFREKIIVSDEEFSTTERSEFWILDY